MSRNPKKKVTQESIYSRFGIDFPSQAKAREGFMVIMRNLLENASLFHSEEFSVNSICWDVCNDLRIKYSADYIDWYFPKDFIGFLRFLESIYSFLSSKRQKSFEAIITKEIEKSEVDLGIGFKKDKFYPTGAKELDKALIEDVLIWLKGKKLEPIKKALHDALENYQEVKDNSAQRQMSSVIKNSYEALEATAKVICNNDKDLSGNRERFIKKLGINEVYKEMLRQYIDFANRFRHPIRKNQKRPQLKKFEVETFLYMSGIFIRLALESLNKSPSD